MREPSSAELLLSQLFVTACFIVTFGHFRPYLASAAVFGDNGDYIVIASGIRHWTFSGITPKLFWGLPYAIAGFSIVFRTSEQISLLILSMGASTVALLLCKKLWGGWIAAFFLALNLEWLQRSILGGAEPLFVALLFAGILLSRRQHFAWAALAGSLATIVRPAGLFFLLALGGVLLWQRRPKEFLRCSLIGVSIGVLYVLPLWIHYGDPLATYHGYHHDWNSSSPLGLPFVALVKGALLPGRPFTNIVIEGFWIILAIAGSLRLLWKTRTVASEQRVEWTFAVLYLTFLFTYNSSTWAFSEFQRFVIPVVPILLAELEFFLPKRRAVTRPLALAGGFLAACSAIGIRNVWR